jgi:hypothetical protein
MYTDSMALAQRVDIEEGECLLALEELHGGDLPYDIWSESWLHQRRAISTTYP